MDNPTTLKVVLGIPWRPTEDRIRPYEFCRPRLQQMYPWAQVLEGDSGHQPFRRGATRNLLVHEAGVLGADVVVLCDADSLPDPRPLADAIEMAYRDGKMHFPFHQAWYMEQKAYQRIELGQTYEQLRSRIIDKCPSQGGCWIMRPDVWWEAGGMDDRIAGWGSEDRAFLAACNTILGPPVIHTGVLLCMPHLQDPNKWLTEDVAILSEYHDRFQQPERMKEYLDSRPDLPGTIERTPEAS